MTLVADPYSLPIPYAYPGTGHQTYAAAFRCDNEACNNLSIGVGELHMSSLRIPVSTALAEMTNLKWTPQRVLRPNFPDVPEQIADTAAEAHACLSVRAYRGAVALARAVVEATAKDKGITKGSLAQKIDKLHEEGHIRSITQQVAHEVREGGNEIAHGDLGDEPMPAEDATAIVRLMDEILHEVYQGPAAMLRLKQSRQAREERNKAEA
ncbi:DUF4145 domain-containing protein [Streptomyces sp. NPDC056227]|uniref:DUF4145 domain-containing protein n=1 Tax=Streptomyces sp. NPDC056227 TaxID=3345753 RepID=UPI0035D82FCF